MTTSQEANLGTIEWGVPGGAPNAALLVHGLTGRGESFQTLVEELDLAGGGSDWRLLAPDLRGRGASMESPEGEGGIREHARDLLALLDREGMERVVYIGHSLGAMVGAYLAAEHPERVSRLVLVDGGADPGKEVDDLIAPAVERLRRTYPSPEAYLEHVKSLPAFQDRWDEYIERYYSDDVYEGDDGLWRPKADSEAVGRDREKLSDVSLNERHAKIRCPTLILLSTVGLASPNEGFILPHEDARRMQETIPDCTLVEVEDTNHYDILYSAPRTAVDAVKGFLARHGG